jgi:hypothetical protein
LWTPDEEPDIEIGLPLGFWTPPLQLPGDLLAMVSGHPDRLPVPVDASAAQRGGYVPMWDDNLGQTAMKQVGGGGVLFTVTNNAVAQPTLARTYPAPIDAQDNGWLCLLSGAYLNNSGGGLAPLFTIGTSLVGMTVNVVTVTLPSFTTNAAAHRVVIVAYIRTTALGAAGTMTAWIAVLTGTAVTNPMAITAANTFIGDGSATVDTTTAHNIAIGVAPGASASASFTPTTGWMLPLPNAGN